MEEAGEDVSDLMEEVEEVNDAIKKSVKKLIEITCGSAFNRKFTTGGVERIMKLSGDEC